MGTWPSPEGERSSAYIMIVAICFCYCWLLCALCSTHLLPHYTANLKHCYQMKLILSRRSYSIMYQILLSTHRTYSLRHTLSGVNFGNTLPNLIFPPLLRVRPLQGQWQLVWHTALLWITLLHPALDTLLVHYSAKVWGHSNKWQ